MTWMFKLNEQGVTIIVVLCAAREIWKVELKEGSKWMQRVEVKLGNKFSSNLKYNGRLAGLEKAIFTRCNKFQNYTGSFDSGKQKTLHFYKCKLKKYLKLHVFRLKSFNFKCIEYKS